MSYSVPPPSSWLRADVARVDLHREGRVEKPRIADLARLHDLDRAEIGFLEMQPVGDHQLDVVLLAGVDHPLAFVRGDGHRFFAQHVNAGLGGPHRCTRSA